MDNNIGLRVKTNGFSNNSDGFCKLMDYKWLSGALLHQIDSY